MIGGQEMTVEGVADSENCEVMRLTSLHVDKAERSTVLIYYALAVYPSQINRDKGEGNGPYRITHAGKVLCEVRKTVLGSCQRRWSLSQVVLILSVNPTAYVRLINYRSGRRPNVHRSLHRQSVPIFRN